MKGRAEEITLGGAAIEFHRRITVALETEEEPGRGEDGLDDVDDAGAAAVKSVGEPENPRELLDELAVGRCQAHEGVMFLLRNRFAVIAGNIGNQLPLSGGEAEEVGMGDEMVGMFVVTGVVDKVADIMEDGRRFEKAFLVISEFEGATQDLEERFCQFDDLKSVVLFKVARGGELKS